jgi:sec-independent protein translocase protein TatA
MFEGKVGLPELILILAIVLIFFGGRRIPEVMKGLGQGIRSFKEGMHGTETSANSSPAGSPSAEQKQ